MYFTILVILHIGGAIFGIGGAGAAGILGPMAAKSDLPTKLVLTRGIIAVDSKLVTPVALVLQPLTGVLILFNRGFNHSFFSTRRLWLITAIVFYAGILYLSYVVARPNTRRMLALLESGTEGEELTRIERAAGMVGMWVGLLTFAVALLMIWKPGSGCGVYIC